MIEAPPDFEPVRRQIEVFDLMREDCGISLLPTSNKINLVFMSDILKLTFNLVIEMWSQGSESSWMTSWTPLSFSRINERIKVADRILIFLFMCIYWPNVNDRQFYINETVTKIWFRFDLSRRITTICIILYPPLSHPTFWQHPWWGSPGIPPSTPKTLMLRNPCWLE